MSHDFWVRASQFLPIILIFFVFYFLIIRPQQKQTKTHKEKLKALKEGDIIVSNGGLIGKISVVREKEIDLEIAKDIRVRVLKAAVADVYGLNADSHSKDKSDVNANSNNGQRKMRKKRKEVPPFESSESSDKTNDKTNDKMNDKTMTSAISPTSSAREDV